ncbi:threonine ammonia-lyase [bacterium]|nr:threonine ammonia-lyase [bacterium]
MAQKSVTIDDINAARQRIRDYAVTTPLREWSALQVKMQSDAPFFLKLETFQNTGSFKVRGAANKILKLFQEKPQDAKHFVAASAGNHAQAVAYVAGKLGVPSTIVMPEGTPLIKSVATAGYGAEVILHGKIYDEAYAKALEVLKEKSGSAYIHAYADEDVIAGQGTCGIEIHEQLLAAGLKESDPVQVVIPIGGGGLVSGTALALKALRPNTKVFGVVSEAADAMSKSFKKGSIVQATRTHPRTLAEGLAVKSVSELTFGYVKELCEDVVVVSDDDVANALFYMMETGKMVAEGSGAAGIAALLSRRIKLDPKVPTVVLICGGNIDVNMISTIIERALVQTERWLSFDLIVEDRPGELARITKLVGDSRANVLDLYHDRLSTETAVGFTKINFRLETRGPDHVKALLGTLKKEGYSVRLRS